MTPHTDQPMGACPVFGFTVQMDPAPGVNMARLWGAFSRLLESRGLQDVGNGEPPDLEFIVCSEGGQATEDDREAVVTWLASHGEISEYGVGPLVDLDAAA
jgi:hypothetical protein